MCKNFWGLNPDANHPPVCEQNASTISAEATAAVTPTPPPKKEEKKGEEVEGKVAGLNEEKKEIGTGFPGKAPLLDKNGNKLMEGVIIGDKNDIPVIVTSAAYKAAQE